MQSAITRDRYDAVLFDLDGIITDTDKLHAACWKEMFDGFLHKRAAEKGKAFCPLIYITTTGSMWMEVTGRKASAGYVPDGGQTIGVEPQRAEPFRSGYGN
jgi:phosphoglycolate phosphatase-like HAD superfamily hydrolase